MHSIQFILIILAKRASLDIQQTISAYLMGIKKSLEYNKLFVTDTQLSRLNEITYAWIKKGLDLNTARVILVTPHGPRPNRIEFQYYLDLFAKHGISAAENDRVYHVEQLPQHIKIITDHDLIQDFLAVSERNKMIGKIFNHNPKMMFKDILAEKAPQVLSTLSRPNNFILFQASPLVKNTCAVAEHQQVLISRL